MVTYTLPRPDARYSDPDYSNCDGSALQCLMGWSLRVVGGSDMTFYGLGFWQVRFVYY
jgi:glucan 1,3-beta-glucosidase